MYSSGSNTLDTEFSSLRTKVNQKTTLTEVINKLYPVGAFWITTSYDSPASLFGGSWEQIRDRFLVGAGNKYGRHSVGGAESVKLTASQIPTLSMQVGLTSAGYVNANKVIQSFIMNNKIGPYGNEGMESDGCSGDPSDKQPTSSDYGVGYKPTSAIRYYNSNQASVSTMPPFYAAYIWRRTA